MAHHLSPQKSPQRRRCYWGRGAWHPPKRHPAAELHNAEMKVDDKTNCKDGTLPSRPVSVWPSDLPRPSEQDDDIPLLAGVARVKPGQTTEMYTLDASTAPSAAPSAFVAKDAPAEVTESGSLADTACVHQPQHKSQLFRACHAHRLAK